LSFATWIDFVLSAVASGGVAGGAVIWLSREWISVRLKSSIQHEYDRKLEAHKSQLKTEQELAILDIKTAVTRDAALHAAAHASFSEGQKASMERKLNGFDRLWGEVLRFRDGLPAVMGFMDLFTVDEYRTVKDHSRFRELTADLSHEKITSLINNDGLIEEVRPYVGEYLWIVFWCYRAILMRILLQLYLGRDDIAKMEWHKDTGTRQLIAAVLTPKEIEAFDDIRVVKVGWLKLHFEAKILASAQQVISGEEFGAVSLKHAMEIQEQVAKVSTADILRHRGI
jgi:hypothetical protein